MVEHREFMSFLVHQVSLIIEIKKTLARLTAIEFIQVVFFGLKSIHSIFFMFNSY